MRIVGGVLVLFVALAALSAIGVSRPVAADPVQPGAEH
jgi:hypothetical protein